MGVPHAPRPVSTWYCQLFFLSHSNRCRSSIFICVSLQLMILSTFPCLSAIHIYSLVKSIQIFLSFKNSLFFKNSDKSGWKYRVPIYPLSPHVQSSLLACLLTTDEPTTQSPELAFSLCMVHSIGFNKCIMMGIHHHSII